MNLPLGIDLHLLPAPLAPQRRLKGLFHPAAPHPITDAIALGLEPFVFLFRNAAGVPQHVGTEAAMGVTTQHIGVHLSPLEGVDLLAKTQHLHTGQARHQRDPEPFGIRPTGPGLIQAGNPHGQDRRQPIPQRRPLGIADLAGLEIEVVGETATRQDIPMAVEDPAANGIAGHQPNAVVIGPGPVFTALDQLQPGEPGHQGAAQHENHHQKQDRLLAHAAMAG